MTWSSAWIAPIKRPTCISLTPAPASAGPKPSPPPAKRESPASLTTNRNKKQTAKKVKTSGNSTGLVQPVIALTLRPPDPLRSMLFFFVRPRYRHNSKHQLPFCRVKYHRQDGTSKAPMSTPNTSEPRTLAMSPCELPLPEMSHNQSVTNSPQKPPSGMAINIASQRKMDLCFMWSSGLTADIGHPKLFTVGPASGAKLRPQTTVNNFAAASRASVLHWLFDSIGRYSLFVFPPRRVRSANDQSL